MHRLRGKPVAECFFQGPSFEPDRSRDPYTAPSAVATDPYDVPPHSSYETAATRQRVDHRNKPPLRYDTAFRGTTYARVRMGVAKGHIKATINLPRMDEALQKLRRAYLTEDHYSRLARGAPLTQESIFAGWDAMRERVVQRVLREYVRSFVPSFLPSFLASVVCYVFVLVPIRPLSIHPSIHRTTCSPARLPTCLPACLHTRAMERMNAYLLEDCCGRRACLLVVLVSVFVSTGCVRARRRDWARP